MTTPRIDSHQHFWRYSLPEYDWIDDSMAMLRRDFLPEHLRPLLDAAGLDGCIAVQAPQSLDETRFLLELAAQNPWIRGVVGWVDLRAADCGAQLREFASNPRLVAVRHIAQSEPDDFLTGEAFGRGIAELLPLDLAYDVLVFPRQLRAATALVTAHAEQRFVLDHLAKPAMRGDAGHDLAFAEWANAIRALAERPNVACKLSGLVTEADWQGWTPATLRPAFDVALEAFGADRLLFGSDWPVCLLASTHERWCATVTSWLAELSKAESAAMFGGNAVRWYRLP